MIKLLLGGSPCFTKGHLVLTKNGYKDISEIQIGDEVLTHKKRFKKVVNIGSKSDYICNLKIMGYPNFETTENHPFYTIERFNTSYQEDNHTCRTFSKELKWIKAIDLTNNHFCGQHIINSNNSNCLEIDEELAWLLGRYIADGHYSKTKTKNRRNSYQYRVVFSIGNYKLEKFKENVKNRHYSCYPHSQSTYRCVFSSMEMVNFLIDNNFKVGAHEKDIPEFIFNLPDNLREKFLDGYLSGDGYYNEKDNSYSASTVSSKLAFGLQRLITSLYKTNCGVCKSHNNRESIIKGRVIKGNYDIYTILFKKELRKQSVAHIQDDIIWTQVKSFEKTNKIDTVYNIEVEEDHSYTVNNCIVHNCTKWSIAQRNRETTCEGEGWELFKNYLIAKELFKPDYYLYENNCSASVKIKNEIEKELGGIKYDFNSNLVSAQNRARFYVTNIPNIEIPKNLSPIMVKDILNHEETNEIVYHLSKEDEKENPKATKTGMIRVGNLYGKDSQGYRVYSINGKSSTLCSESGGIGANTGLYKMPNGDIRKLTVSEARRLQTIPDWVDLPVSDRQAYKQLGNGWTIEVIKSFLSKIPNIENEEILVLSMYDGMGCGYITLKELNYKIKEYISVEIDKYCQKTLDTNIPNRIAFNDAFDIRNEKSELYKLICNINNNKF